VGALAFATVVAVERATVLPLAQMLVDHPDEAVTRDVPLAAQVLLVPVAFAVAAFIVASLAVRVIRLAVYSRAVHRHARSYLAQHAPLYRLGIQPRAVRFAADGQARDRDSHNTGELFERSRTLLLLGGPGAGKTVAVYAYLYELTRRRRLLPLILGREPLPIFVSLASYQSTTEPDHAALEHFITRQVRLFSTAGLGRSVPHLLRVGKVCLLCDDLDALEAPARTATATELEALAAARRGGARVIVTFSMPAYLAAPRALAPLRGFDRAVLEALGEGDVVRALRRNRRPASVRPEGDMSATLQRHQLQVSTQLPATLSALLALWPTERPLPTGRVQLFAESVELWTDEGAREGVSGERVRVILGALAATQRRLDLRVLPVPPGQALGKAVTAWIEQEGPLMPAQSSDSGELVLVPQEVERACQSALAAGILVRAPDGHALAFAHALLEAAFAGTWLRMADDGLGRITPELLRPQWVLPLLLWRGGLHEPGDLAQRVFRLADTPDSTAARAGLTSSAEAAATTLAVALALLVEGLAALLATGDTPDAAAVFEVGQQHLRDLLDAAQRTLARPDDTEVLAASLRAVEREAGAELVANMTDLAQSARLARLARAHLIMLLGLLATERALDAVVALLAETDPVLRQAVSQALTLAGAAALEPLRAALNDANERVRTRASEALAQLGGQAIATALAALERGDASSRITAAQTLGALRTPRAVAPLIAELDDPDTLVRVAAALALGEIASAPAVQAVQKLVSNDEAQLRVAAAQALGASHDVGAVPALLKLLADGEGVVRAAAAQALGILGDDRAVPALHERRSDPDPLTQNAVLNALRRLGRP
jgi:HEAT repeat protein